MMQKRGCYIQGMKCEELIYLHISMYFTMVRCIFLLFKAGINPVTDGGIRGPRTAGWGDKIPLEKWPVTLGRHLHRTQHNKALLPSKKILLK